MASIVREGKFYLNYDHVRQYCVNYICGGTLLW